MIDVEKLRIYASCEISLVVLYMVQQHMISANEALEVTNLISKTFIRSINAYNAKESEDKG